MAQVCLDPWHIDPRGKGGDSTYHYYPSLSASVSRSVSQSLFSFHLVPQRERKVLRRCKIQPDCTCLLSVCECLVTPCHNTSIGSMVQRSAVRASSGLGMWVAMPPTADGLETEGGTPTFQVTHSIALSCTCGGQRCLTHAEGTVLALCTRYGTGTVYRLKSGLSECSMCLPHS